MTDTKEPTTEAGRRLLARVESLADSCDVWLDSESDRRYMDVTEELVLAIESEARATPGLDVERLAEALHFVQAFADGHGDPTADPDEVCRIDAAAIARNYTARSLSVMSNSDVNSPAPEPSEA